MLTEDQKNYLNKQPKERAEMPVHVFPYNPQTEIVADKVMGKIREKLPDADIRYMGASALKISGQNDVDIYIVTPAELKGEYLSKLSPVFGEQNKKWNWYEEGVEVSVYLSDPADYKFQEQLEIFRILKNDLKLLKEYEELKESVNGKNYIEYQTAKYEFYNRVLGIN